MLAVAICMKFYESSMNRSSGQMMNFPSKGMEKAEKGSDLNGAYLSGFAPVYSIPGPP
jgi:hypothetical protein